VTHRSAAPSLRLGSAHGLRPMPTRSEAHTRLAALSVYATPRADGLGYVKRLLDSHTIYSDGHTRSTNRQRPRRTGPRIPRGFRGLHGCRGVRGIATRKRSLVGSGLATPLHCCVAFGRCLCCIRSAGVAQRGLIPLRICISDVTQERLSTSLANGGPLSTPVQQWCGPEVAFVTSRALQRDDTEAVLRASVVHP
jgi:hypothetical protein